MCFKQNYITNSYFFNISIVKLFTRLSPSRDIAIFHENKENRVYRVYLVIRDNKLTVKLCETLNALQLRV